MASTDYKGENYRIWWDDTRQLGRVWARGRLDEKTTESYTQALIELYRKHGKVDWLSDLSEYKMPSSKVRRMIAETMRMMDIGKLAYVGAPLQIRVAANFVSSFAGKTNYRHFNSEAAALSWLITSNAKIDQND